MKDTKRRKNSSSPSGHHKTKKNKKIEETSSDSSTMQVVISKKGKNQLLYLTNKERDKICKKYPVSFSTFEDKFSKKIQKQLIDPKYSVIRSSINYLKKINKLPASISPQNDFYTYTNYLWIKDPEYLEKNRKYIVQIDNFRLVQDRVYRQLLDIVKHYTETNNTKLSREIKNIYDSFLHYNNNEQTSKYATQYVDKLDDIRKNPANLWKWLAYINQNEVVSWGSPLSWTINPDDKNPKIFRSYVNGPQFTLIDINVYFDDGTDVQYKMNYRKRYFQYLNEIFSFIFGKNHGFHVKDVYDIEVELIYAMGCSKVKNGNSSSYNVITTKEAEEKYQFSWKEFSQELGFETTPHSFITTNLNYLKCGTEILLKNWTSERWRTYWIYLFIRELSRFNNRGTKIYYDFQGKYARGQESKLYKDLRPIFGLGFAFNTFLTNQYIQHYENKERIQYVKTLAEDLKTVFTRIITRNEWLQPETKEKALLKLKHFEFVVGSPKLLREDPLLDYSKDDVWGNIEKISAWRFRKAVKLEGKETIDIPVIDWANIPPKFIGTQAYVVNASYTPSKNSIYIPLGYIQEPFVDLGERGIEWNLAHIGFTLGHEMSHSLDDWGSKYNWKGELEDWWSEKDKKIYHNMQKDVIRQYEEFALRDGIKFDASIGIGEDLADISGLAIVLEYLNDFQNKNKDIFQIRKLSFEAFFTYYAYQQRQIISKKAISAQLHTNPHPLDKYRTNVPLSRMAIFRHIYNIKKGDGMWWHNTTKVWMNE